MEAACVLTLHDINETYSIRINHFIRYTNNDLCMSLITKCIERSDRIDFSSICLDVEFTLNHGRDIRKIDSFIKTWLVFIGHLLKGPCYYLGTLNN